MSLGILTIGLAYPRAERRGTVPDVHGGGFEVWRTAERPAPTGDREQADSAVADAGGATAATPRWWRWLTAASLAAIAIALLLGTWLSRRNEWTPTLDIAALELRVHAMSHDFPLVGVFSRMGWYHPGPAFIIQEWLPYRLFGVNGLAYGVVLGHLVALGLAWWAATRLNRVAGACVLLAGVLVLWAREPAQAMEPWNPWAGLIATITLMIAAWSAGERHRLGAVLVLPVASYLLQAHLGFAPLVGLLIATAAVAAIWPGDRGRQIPWAAWLLGAGLSVLMWLPPLYEQLTRSPGNATLIVQSFGKEPPQGLVAGLLAVADGFAVPPSWFHYSLLLPSSAGFPWLLLLPIAATAAALLRRDRLRITAMAVCWASIVAVVVAVAFVSGAPAEYLVGWIPAVACTTVLLSAWIVCGLWAPQRLRVPSWTAAAALQLAAAALAVVTAFNWSAASQLDAPKGRTAAALTEALVTDAGARPAEIVAGELRPSEILELRQVFYGVLAGAVRDGMDIAAPQNIVWETTGAVPADGGGDRVHYELQSISPGRTYPAGTRVVARYDPFTPEQWQAILAVDAQLGAPNLTPEQRMSLDRERFELTGGQAAFEIVAVDPQ